MSIKKNKAHGNYVKISQHLLHDQRLGIAERGLMATLLSLSDSWNFTVAGLAEILPDGKEKLTNSLRRLEKLGYLKITQIHDNLGKFNSNLIEINEIPLRCETQPEDADDREAEPLSGNPSTGKPLTGKPLTGKPPQVSINKVINNRLSIKREEVTELSIEDYQILVNKYGKEMVDGLISKIKERHYKRCMNYKTIDQWCREKRNQNNTGPPRLINHGFEQRNYDFDELERILLAN